VCCALRGCGVRACWACDLQDVQRWVGVAALLQRTKMLVQLVACCEHAVSLHPSWDP
jgi:hypothetical protein